MHLMHDYPMSGVRVAVVGASGYSGGELVRLLLGHPSAEVVARVDDLGLVLTNRWFRSLGESGSQLREGLRFDLDLVSRLTEGTGFSFSAEGALFAHLGKHQIFTPTKTYPPMTVCELAAPTGDAAKETV